MGSVEERVSAQRLPLARVCFSVATRNRRTVSLVWRNTLAALAMVLFGHPSASVGAPQALLVTKALLGTAASAASPTGFLKILGTLDDTATRGGFETALLAGAVGASVTDASQFSVQLSVLGCRRHGERIHCKSSDRNMILSLTPTATPFVHRVIFRVRRIPGTATGTSPLLSPVRVTLHGGPSVDRIDVISDCRRSGARRLICLDRARPNILFIVTDDQRWDTVHYMPHVLDRLAAHGVSFTNAFVTTPSCATSRASMLAGQYGHHHGVLTLAAPNGGATKFVGPDASTLATWLHDQGYRTGMYGKYLTDYAAQCPPYAAVCYIPPGWDEWHVFLLQHYYNYMLAENGQITSFGSAPADYSTDVIAAKAVEFIESAEGQPFFLHIGFHAPHQEGGAAPIPAPRHSGSFAGVPLWRPPSYDEEDITDKPPWLGLLARAGTIVSGFLTYGAWGDVVRQRQLETLSAVDEGVDALMAALEETGQADNTLIVFTSDNGYMWGEHRYFSGKDVPYEESIRVPLIIRYPRLIAAPRNDASPALNIDLAPTLAGIAGAVVPAGVDGRSLEPLLRDPATTWREDFLIEHWNSDDESAGQPPFAGVRTEQWKYVSYAGGESELYDLAGDPYELTNLAHDPAYASVAAGLDSRLDELQQ